MWFEHSFGLIRGLFLIHLVVFFMVWAQLLSIFSHRSSVLFSKVLLYILFSSNQTHTTTSVDSRTIKWYWLKMLFSWFSTQILLIYFHRTSCFFSRGLIYILFSSNLTYMTIKVDSRKNEQCISKKDYCFCSLQESFCSKIFIFTV